jgi:hypothetical protein
MIYVLMILAIYPIFIRNDETPTILFKIDFFYNKVRREPIEILKGNHSSGFKAIRSYGAKKI